MNNQQTAKRLLMNNTKLTDKLSLAAAVLRCKVIALKCHISRSDKDAILTVVDELLKYEPELKEIIDG